MSKNLHIDHLVYATPDLASAVADIESRFGVAPTPGGAHLGLGAFNALLGLVRAHTSKSSAPIPLNPRQSPPAHSALMTSRHPSWWPGARRHNAHSAMS